MNIELKRLSDYVREVDVVHSDRFVVAVRSAAVTGSVLAAELPEKFELPKEIRKRDGSTVKKTVFDMAIAVGPEMDKFILDFNLEMSERRVRGVGGSRLRPGMEAMLADEKLFFERARLTGEKIRANENKGRNMAAKRFPSETPSPAAEPVKVSRKRTK
jgi:hypothetical protein